MELAGKGYDVVLAARTADRLEAVAEELRAIGRRVLAIPTDVRDREQVINLVQKAIEYFGAIDILVNNAAISDHFEPVGAQNVELWDRLMSINLRAPMLLSRAVVQTMLQHEHVNGNILNILSMAAHAGMVSGKITPSK